MNLDKEQPKTYYLSGGTIHTEITTPGKKLVTETKHYGNHTEITTKKWKKNK